MSTLGWLKHNLTDLKDAEEKLEGTLSEMRRIIKTLEMEIDEGLLAEEELAHDGNL